MQPARDPQRSDSMKSSPTCTRGEFIRRGLGGLGAAALLATFPAPSSQAASLESAPTTNPATYDLRDFVRWIIEDFEPSVRLPGPTGNYARKPGEASAELYGVADMACILYTIGRLHPTEKERAEWAAALQSFQNPDTGYLLEKNPTHPKLHNTAFALAAMQLFEVQPLYELKFAAEYRDIRASLMKLDWKTRVYPDSHSGAGIGAIYALSPALHSTPWFEEYFAVCESLFDPNNGMIGQNKPPGGDFDQVGGTFHYSFLYEHLNRQMPFPEKRIDAILGLQQPDGYWNASNHQWLTLDAIYMLTRAVRHHPYRVEDVRRAVRHTMDVLMNDLYSPEGRKNVLTGRLAVHSVTAAISIAAEVQQFLGADCVKTDWPLHLVLDRRPFI